MRVFKILGTWIKRGKEEDKPVTMRPRFGKKQQKTIRKKMSKAWNRN